MKHFFQRPLFVIAFSLVAIFFLFSLRQTAQKSKVSQNNVDILEQNISDLASDIEKEEHRLELSKTQLAKEKIIRNELLMQKPGEYVLQLPEKTETQESLKTLENDPNSNINKWWKLLF